MSLPIVLSHFHVDPGLAKKEIGETVEISPDLGLSAQEVQVSADGLVFPNGDVLTWGMVEQISAAETKCFQLQGGDLIQISAFSEETNRVYTLMPTKEAPTLLISGIPMHRIKGTTPNRDTSEKIKTVGPIHGEVLDTTTGLGYTAIGASNSADHVFTVELDPVVLQVAQCNPWSQDLFVRSNITQMVGDCFDIIGQFEKNRFSIVIHDPPTFSLAGDLYSRAFYDSIYRVLKKNGRLFHYVGNPESRSGRNVTMGVEKRLLESGFSKVRRAPKAYGIIAYK